MPFDVKAFKKAKFEDRTEDVPVPELKRWFSEDEEPVITVRSLTGIEVAICRQAAEKYSTLKMVLEKIASSMASEKADGVSEILKLGDNTPEEAARRIEYLRLGCVSPELDVESAPMFFENYPMTAWVLTNKIIELTGEGRSPGESKPSGKKQKSKAQ
jgi:hypothetical protein